MLLLSIGLLLSKTHIFQLIDYVALGYSTFFLGPPTWEKMLLYPSNRVSRSIYYSCFSIYHLLQYSKDEDLGPFSSSRHLYYTAGFLLLASLGNLFDSFSKWLSRQIANFDWMDIATSPSGTLWYGAGNGNWFFFFGHNGYDDFHTIIPTAFVENLTVIR
jgi:hypothetical protein